MFDQNGCRVTPKAIPSDDLGKGYVNVDASVALGEWLGVIEEQNYQKEQDDYWAKYLTWEWDQRGQPDGFVDDFAMKTKLLSGPVTIINEDGFQVVHAVTGKPFTGQEPASSVSIPERCESIIAECKRNIVKEIALIHRLTAV